MVKAADLHDEPRIWVPVPSIDVVIPCYNHGRFLPECLDSVLCQGVADIRVLIVDNASTDGSVEVARRLASCDPRIHLLLREQNLGPHASFNAGVDWAESDYFLILCADDLIAPRCLERAFAVLEREKASSFAYGGQVIWQASESRPKLHASDNLRYTVVDGRRFIEAMSMPHNPIGTGSIVVRTSAQKAAGHYRPELYYTDDLEMLMRLAALGNPVKIKAVQGVRRRHGANISADYWGNWKRELQEVLSAFESFFAHEGAIISWTPGLRRSVRRNIAHRAYWAGLAHRLRGLKRDSDQLLAFAQSLEPSTRIIPPLSYWFRVQNAWKLIGGRICSILASWFALSSASSGAKRG